MTPAVAVVVATHDRAHLLERLVAALEAQDLDEPFEVVVVDDGSTDDTPRVLPALAERAGVPIRAHRIEAAGGPGPARNAGWRATDAAVIAFTDDDCEPEPGWLRALVTTARRVDADVVQGRTIPHPAQLDTLGPFSRTLSVDREDGYYQTCNIAYRRSLLERLGGFDERFGLLAGEDTDLAWRAIEAGAATAFASDAVVRHDVRPSSLLVQLRDLPRWQGVARVVRRHPRVRGLFPAPRVWKASHPPAVLAALGLAVAVTHRRPAAIALVVPYVHHRLSVNPLRGGPRRRVAAIPGALAVDLGEVLTLAVASARERTLIL